MHLYTAAAIGLAIGLASSPALADGMAVPKRVLQKRTYIEHQVAPFRQVPPCWEQHPILLGCAPRILLEGPPPLWAVQLQRSLLVKQRTPYPQLSPWPPYH